MTELLYELENEMGTKRIRDAEAKIEDAHIELSNARSEYLVERGWHRTVLSGIPGSMLRKKLDDGREILIESDEAAVKVQQRIDAVV